jgi:hypothetical protein
MKVSFGRMVKCWIP